VRGGVAGAGGLRMGFAAGPYRRQAEDPQMTRDQIVAACAAAAVLGLAAMAHAQEKAPAPTGWQTTVAAGVNMTAGNTDTMTLNGSATTEKKQPAYEAKLGIEGNYGEADDAINVRNGKAYTDGKLKKEKNYAYGNLTALTDSVAGINYRAMEGVGVGRYLIQNAKTAFSAEVGGTHIGEELEDTLGEIEKESYWTYRAAERLEQKLGEKSKAWEMAEYLPKSGDFEKYLLNAEVGVESPLTGQSSLRVVVQRKYDSEPAAGREDTDVAVIGSLVFKL
jgi:putative salt-induced outer membrane protein YdiY